MPLRKKKKIRNKIIFWTIAALVAFLMAYIPNRNPADVPYVEMEIGTRN